MQIMRDLMRYQQDYNDLPFESYHIKFRRRKVLESISKHKHDSILEVGCGMEPLFITLQDFQEFTIIEPTIAFYKNAIELKKHLKDKNITIHNLLLENSLNTLSKKQYDFIVLSGLLHEVEDPEKILDVVFSISSPDTVIHINVLNGKSFHRLLAKEMNVIESLNEKSEKQILLQQKSTFDMESLRKMIVDKKFEILESGSYFIKPFTDLQMKQLLEHGIITEEVLNSLYKMTNHLPEMGAEIYFNIRKNA